VYRLPPGPREAQAISEAPAEPALPGRRVRPLEGGGGYTK